MKRKSAKSKNGKQEVFVPYKVSYRANSAAIKRLLGPVSQASLAKKLGVSAQRLNAVVRGRSLCSTEFKERIERILAHAPTITKRRAA